MQQLAYTMDFLRLSAQNVWIAMDEQLPLTISLKAAGDLGPSGVEGHHKRMQFLEKQSWSEHCLLPGGLACCYQTHTLKVLVIPQAELPYIAEAFWSNDAQPELSYRRSELDPELANGQNPLDLSLACNADGILTDLPINLGITVADCMPIALQYGTWRALLHSGWQGTGIVWAALQAMQFQRVFDQQSLLQIVLGPSVCTVCYPVDKARAQLFAARFGIACTPTLADGQPGLDIRQANINLITRFFQTESLHDVLRNLQLRVCADCTVQQGQLQSYRRDQAAFGRSLVVFAAS